ncbi:hypothetical protein D3C71_1956190 [compost metagenome]
MFDCTLTGVGLAQLGIEVQCMHGAVVQTGSGEAGLGSDLAHSGTSTRENMELFLGNLIFQILRDNLGVGTHTDSISFCCR